MIYDFNYLIGKINNSDFEKRPFKHVYIEDFFSEEHFNEIVTAGEINIPASSGDSELFENLFNRGYKIVEFPGCITDKEKYIDWHENRKGGDFHTACEGFGVTLRLFEAESEIIKSLREFLASEKFNACIAKKIRH